MRRSLPLALCLIAAAPLAARETPKDVIERAVKAHGGLEQLSKLRADKVNLKGTLVVTDRPLPFTSETWVQLPGQLKSVVKFTLNDKDYTLVQTLDGEKGSVTLDGVPQKLEAATLAELAATLEVDRAVRLVPLLTEKGWEVSALDDAKVGERTAAGVKVVSAAKKELRLYFDRETGLLVKTEHLVRPMGGKEVKQEVFYSDFKDLGGYKRPTKVVALRDGKKLMDAEMTDVKYFEKIDAAEFRGP